MTSFSLPKHQINVLSVKKLTNNLYNFVTHHNSLSVSNKHAGICLGLPVIVQQPYLFVLRTNKCSE